MKYKYVCLSCPEFRKGPALCLLVLDRVLSPPQAKLLRGKGGAWLVSTENMTLEKVFLCMCPGKNYKISEGG